MYAEKIKSPADVKRLNESELTTLAQEMRNALLTKLSNHGGHIGPNLGMVEATIALHYVFNSPTDKMVYDVSHQSYSHKMLTGRMFAFLDPNEYDSVTGYTNIIESEHDFFNVGHTSTSVSLACGLAKARDLKGEKDNIIAIIGDGSLSGGEALEGLSNAGAMDTNMIIVVNDNEMSIAENHGGLYKSLKTLRESNGTSSNNLFKAMGLDYVYAENGNDIQTLIEAFNSIKDTTHPTVVHIHTLKGKGYAPAEKDKESWHWGMPFDLETGKPKFEDSTPDYGELTAEFLLKKMEKDPKVVAITSGTPTVMGFYPELRKKAGKQFVDVGIAEEHAIALASGIAANGATPVYGVYSTFIQRTYDQLSQDLCLNNNPAVIPVFMGTLMGMNDMTHLGFFDMAILGNIPNLVYLAPTCKNEYFSMLDWAMTQKKHPVAIRVPGGPMIEGDSHQDTDYSELNKFKTTHNGSEIAILGLGAFFSLAESVAEKLKSEKGINATVINPRYITGIDTELLEELKSNHKLVITLEDGILNGGFGEKIASFYGDSNMKVLNFGLKKEFADRYNVQELLEENHLTDNQIIEDAIKVLNQN